MTTRLTRTATPDAIENARALVRDPLTDAVQQLGDPRMRRIAGYQLGLWDADGEPSGAQGGKAIRPALALLAARAVCGDPLPGVPAAVAVELVHNFSLLHDDIMDRDVERRHRPTGWVVFGEGQAILAGNAMLTAAVQTLLRDPDTAAATVPILMSATQHLVSGQSADLALEGERDVALAEVLTMAEGKTASLISCSLALGGAAAGAPQAALERLGEVGRLLGLAFQIVDDILGVVGDAAATGKSASSDVRAGKRSVPVVLALNSGTSAARELHSALAAGLPATDDQVARIVGLIRDTGAIETAEADAERLLEQAVAQIDTAGLADTNATRELQDVARFLVRRNW